MRVAIVGLGTIAKTHVGAWERLPGVDFVASVDVRDIEGWGFRGRRVPIHRSVEELAAYQPDCVVVATPTPHHYQACGEILGCLQTRILIEKPLASTLSDSLALLERTDDLVVLYHAAYAPEVRWAAERLSGWLDQFGPIRSFQCMFSDPWRDDPKTAATRYVSSWVDSGINCLSVLARLVRLEDLIDFTAIDERSSVYEAAVRFSSRGQSGRGDIRTSWDVATAAKHTTVEFGTGVTLVLNHQEVNAVARDERGATIERFRFDHSTPRLVSHYVNLYASVLFDAQPYAFGVEENKLLYRLLFGAVGVVTECG